MDLPILLTLLDSPASTSFEISCKLLESKKEDYYMWYRAGASLQNFCTVTRCFLLEEKTFWSTNYSLYQFPLDDLAWYIGECHSKRMTYPSYEEFWKELYFWLVEFMRTKII